MSFLDFILLCLLITGNSFFARTASLSLTAQQSVDQLGSQLHQAVQTAGVNGTRMHHAERQQPWQGKAHSLTPMPPSVPEESDSFLPVEPDGLVFC